jgi:hypothetical protein
MTRAYPEVLRIGGTSQHSDERERICDLHRVLMNNEYNKNAQHWG